MSLKGKHKQKKRPRSSSDSGSESEHELFHYRDDRVRLMKEVFKILKLKKIKSLAPEGIKHLDMEEVNTMLFEELLGISNKRLKKILEGQNADDASSSSDEDKVDIISLDSISDDEILFIDEKKEDNAKKPKCQHKKHKVKKELNETKVKAEKESKVKKEKVKEKITTGLENEKLLSVLELLELQARARAIRSQLALEAENKAKEANVQPIEMSDNDDDAVIIETPSINEIVISSSSDSEQEAESAKKNDSEVEWVVVNDKENAKSSQDNVEESIQVVVTVNNESTLTETVCVIANEENSPQKKTQKIKLIRSIVVEPALNLELSDIPLPVQEKQNGPPATTSSPVTDAEVTNVVPEDNDVETVAETLNDDNTNVEETNCNIEGTNETETAQTKESVETFMNQDNQSDNKKLGDIKMVINNHVETSDNDEDVIRLDIVEIDGIDY